MRISISSRNGVKPPLSKMELSSVGDDQRVDDLTAVNATENKKRSLLRVNHLFVH